MAVFSCDCRRDCVTIPVVVSLIIGIITAFLTITGVIAVTPAFLWVLLGVAVVYLAVTLIAVALRERGSACRCLCTIINALLIGILGTALFAVVLLAVTFAATSVIGAIITGLLLFFASLILTSTAYLVRCLINCND